ncbi:MAG: S-layer homology domain-containing protein [Patescibacteria group bacterium]
MQIKAILLPAPGTIGTGTIPVNILPATSLIQPAISSVSIPHDSITRSQTNIQFFSSTISNDISITLSGEGTGSKVALPSGLIMTAPTWDGTVNVSYATTIPPNIQGVDSGKVISIKFKGMEGIPVGLSKAAVVVIPYPNFGNLTNSTVKINDMANKAYTLGHCNGTQYISGALADPDSYSLKAYELDGAQHCYKYDDENVYAVTNHFSTFIAGTAPPLPPTTSINHNSGSNRGGGGGGTRESTLQFISSTPESVTNTTPKTIITESVQNPPEIQETCQFKMIQPKKIYNDVPLDAWYSAAVTRLSDLGILKKKRANELLGPSGKILRYEALIFAMDGFGIKPAKTKDKNLLEKYIKTAKRKGIISTNKSISNLNETINRSEAIALLLRAAEINTAEYVNSTAKHYDDVTTNQWYFPFVTKAHELCIIGKSSNNKFYPFKKVSRSEFIVMLDRIMQKLNK